MIKKVCLDYPIVDDFSVLYNLSMLYKCDLCKSEYQECPSHHKKTINHFCSMRCYGKSKQKKVILTCLNCKNNFALTPSRIATGAGKYCTEICRREYEKKHKLTKQSIWTKYNQSKKGIEYKKQWHKIKDFGCDPITTESVCVICLSNIDLVVHHKDGKNGRNGKTLNNARDNLVVICRRCHPRFHGRWGLKEVVSID